MSLLFMSMMAMIVTSIFEGIEDHRQRLRLARRRARRYTFN